jgi:DNA-binding FrmR family transcriptional regulator
MNTAARIADRNLKSVCALTNPMSCQTALIARAVIRRKNCPYLRPGIAAEIHPSAAAALAAGLPEQANSSCVTGDQMKFTDASGKTALQRRLRRIEGQVRGIAGMIEEERDCREIFQQLSAARSALQGVTLQLAEQAINDCLVNTGEDMEVNKVTAHDLMEILSKV